MKAPCFNCENREPGCHGKCKEYIAFDAENQERRKEASLCVLENKQLKNRYTAAKIFRERNAITRELMKK